jgi:hypothetical protein
MSRGAARVPEWQYGRAPFAHTKQEDLEGTKRDSFQLFCVAIGVAIA